MAIEKVNILAKLKKGLLNLQGFKTISKDNSLDHMLGKMIKAFPNESFPLSAIHEFISIGAENNAATNGFISTLLCELMRNNGAAIWISASRNIFPPALKGYGISPDKIIFIDLNKEKQILWVMEEALKCNGLSAVIAEMQELSFTDSRRLQLAVEQSKVTGFIIRRNPRYANTTACLTRWKISPLASELLKNMPGVGFPRWNVELLKVRNGKPGSWQLEFIGGYFKHLAGFPVFVSDQKRKVG